MKNILFLIMVNIFLPCVVTGTIIHIPGDYPTIQAGIDAAMNGDTVLVSDGTYTGDGNRDIVVQWKAITVMSVNGPENCIIDCQGSAQDNHRGFYFHNEETENSVVNGFTITNGYLSVLHGGGIYCSSNCSLTVMDCTISGNTADSGSGIFCGSNCSVTVIGCTITGNTAHYNGALYCNYGSAITLENCTISENGGNTCCWFDDLNATIHKCTISGNQGVGICSVNFCIVTISDSTISNNSGGGIYDLMSNL